MKKRTIYDSNFLEQVICRIDFQPIEIGGLKEFSDAIKTEFPIVEQTDYTDHTINVDIPSGTTQKTTANYIIWTYSQKNKKMRIEISDRYLIIVHDKYKSFEDLTKGIEIASKFIDKFQIKSINRMGLRYKNVMDSKDIKLAKLHEYINRNLVGVYNFALELQKAPSRAMGQLTLREEDCEIKLNFAIWNMDNPI